MNYVSQAEVVNVIKHNAEIREYELRLDKERRYNPGSFVQLTLDLVTASDIWPDSRTFSIASYKKGVMNFIIIKNVGEYTNRIFDELIGNCEMQNEERLSRIKRCEADKKRLSD